MNAPVYERMRSPITPPKAKPLNLPRIKVKKWREELDRVSNVMLMHDSTVSIAQLAALNSHINYLKGWIDYAEAILNDGADPSIPFRSSYRASAYLGPTCDPRRVHPVIKMEDFV